MRMNWSAPEGYRWDEDGGLTWDDRPLSSEIAAAMRVFTLADINIEPDEEETAPTRRHP